MFLSEVKTTNFRNLQNLSIKLSSDLNIICGNNAAGKSSLLEAICYLVSGRSFRTSKQNLLISHNLKDFTLFGQFSDNTKLGVNYNYSDKSKRMKLNGLLTSTLSTIASIYPVQVLSPESYHLIDSGPLERRKYLDWLLFHVEHRYQSVWKNFQKSLKQRNSFLRSSNNNCNQDELAIWNNEYVANANKIDQLRLVLVNELLPHIKKILRLLNFEHVDKLNFSYYSGYTGNLLDRLKESLTKDLLTGNTQYGPHKSDFRIKVGKNLAKDVLSRGQKKLLVNGLYLAQTEILKEKTEKDSLFIVDDFSSELDESNQQLLIKTLLEQKNVQIILSCLQAEMLNPLIKGYNKVSMFHVEHGILSEIEIK